MKKLLSLLAVIAVLCLTVSAVACENPPVADADLDLVLDFDETCGEAAFKDGFVPEKATDLIDKTLTLVITPKEDYLLKAVTLNEKDITETAQADGNSFLVPITVSDEIADLDSPVKVHITVTFEKKPFEPKPLSAARFANLKKLMHIEGKYTYDVLDSEEWDSYLAICTVFDDDLIYQKEYDPETDEVFYDAVFGKDKKYLVKYSHNLDNTIESLPSDEFFADYYNPFLLISASALVENEDGSYSFVSDERASAAASAITGYIETVDVFKIYFDEDDNPSRFFIKTAEITTAGNLKYVSTYDLAVSEIGTAKVPEEFYKPYPTLPEHAILNAALGKAQAAQYYIIRHQGHELYVPDELVGTEGYEDTDYKLYVSRDDMIFDAYKGEENGYKLMPNGYVYPFFLTNVDGSVEVTLQDPINADFADINSLFTGFKAELFAYAGKSDGYDVFVPHNADYAADLMPFFGEGVDEKKYYVYSTKMKLFVKDETLAKVEFSYTTYGISEDVTLTYDFDVDPEDANGEYYKAISVLDFENATKVSVLDPFKGEYKDAGGNYCYVDNSGFILNGTPLENTSYVSSQSMFIGTWKGIAVSVSLWSSRQLLIQSDDLEINMTLSNIKEDAIAIPEGYHGEWSIDNDEENIRYVFLIQTYAVWVNGEQTRILSCTEKEGLTVVCGSDTFNFMLTDTDNGVPCEPYLAVLVTFADMSYIIFSVDKVGGAGVEIPAEYVGIYLSDADNQKVVITYYSIKINGEKFEITSYSDKDGFVGSYNGKDPYYIQFYYSNQDKLAIGNENENYILERVENLYEDYIDVWASDESQPYTFIFKITDTAIFLTAKYSVQTGTDEEGNPVYENYVYNNEALDFSFGDYGYEFQLRGRAFTSYLLLGRTTVGATFLTLFDDNSNDDFMIILKHSSLNLIGNDFVGSWTGSDGKKDYSVKILADASVEIDFGTGTFKIDATVFDKEESTISFVFRSVSYTLSLGYGNISPEVVLTDNNGLEISLADSVVIEIPSTFYGTWVSSNPDNPCTVEIGENYFRIKFDGEFININYVVRDGTSDSYLFSHGEMSYELYANYIPEYGVTMYLVAMDAEENYSYYPLQEADAE